MNKEKIYQTNFTNTLMLFDSKQVGYQNKNVGFGFEREYKVNDDLYVYASVATNYEGKYTIDDFQFTGTTKRLLVFLIMKFTNLSSTEREYGEIEFTTKEFTELCNLKDRDNTKRLIEKDLFNLMCVRAEYKGKEIFLLEDIGIGRGKFVAVIHEDLIRELTSHKGIILLPLSYFELSLNRSCEAPGWLYFLVCQSFVNSKKSNKNRISVNSLLVRSSFMDIDEIRQTSNCSVKERVTLPFIRNLSVLSETFELKYFNSKGAEISTYRLQNLSYEELVKVIIHYEIK